MTVISVNETDTGGETTRWDIPDEPELNQSPIPRGLRHYGETKAVPALGAGDETSVNITFTFPNAFIYLPKSITFEFQSDDSTTEMENIGVIEFRPAANATLGVMRRYALVSDGAGFVLGLNAVQVYRPLGTWRQWVNGPRGDTMLLRVSDISMDASAAGDINWTADFWEYDIEQCFKWPINTPQPQFSY